MSNDPVTLLLWKNPGHSPQSVMFSGEGLCLWCVVCLTSWWQMESISGPLMLLGHVNNPSDHQEIVHVLPLPRPLAPSELFLAEMVTHLLGNAETQEVFTWFGTFFPLW